MPEMKRNPPTFYNELPSLARHILKFNVLMIGVDMNAKKAKDEIGLVWCDLLGFMAYQPL